MSENYSYDEVPYPAASYAQSHPDRLSIMAKLFGMQPPDISNCRVLELGCADGSNLIPMAKMFPESTFVGIDLSALQINNGIRHIEKLGISNIEMIQMDIMDVDKSLGMFDYIIAHGIYSWVPPTVRNKIFQVCKLRLNENGAAYISYNTFPGWHMRGMLRNMMQYHTQTLKDPRQRIQQARALVQFLSKSIPTENNAYGMLLKNELDCMQGWQDNYFYHDSLEDINEPCYFHEFMADATSHGLQYLGEADFSSMLAINFSEEIRETLKSVGGNIIAMEQYMDFIRNRMFRQTILCHSDVRLDRNLKADVVRDFYLKSQVRIEGDKVDVNSDEKQEYVLAQGKFSVDQPVGKAAWNTLCEQNPKSISFTDLLDSVCKQIKVKDKNKKEEMANVLQEAIFKAYAKNIVSLHGVPVDVQNKPSKKPMVDLFVRLRAQQSSIVTNAYHQSITLDPLNQLLVRLLDGKHDEKELASKLSDLITEGKLTLKDKEEDVTDPKQVKKLIAAQIVQRLKFMAASGLLIG